MKPSARIPVPFLCLDKGTLPSCRLAVLPGGTGSFWVGRSCCCSPGHPGKESWDPWERRVPPSLVVPWECGTLGTALGSQELLGEVKAAEAARSCASLRCSSGARQVLLVDTPGFGSRAGEWELLSPVAVLWMCFVRVSHSRETFIR